MASEQKTQMYQRGHQKKAALLGMPCGTATARLRKSLLYEMVVTLGRNICYRCQKAIETIDEFSIDHKEPWQGADDPQKCFFDIKNIAYSHLSCNVGAASRPNKVYQNESIRIQASRNRWYANNQKAIRDHRRNMRKQGKWK